ncbi:MAG TPA: cell wall-binding repeat-containing protein, partial [Microbacterium sp.]|nr:cell wall-binding repeat-containing protein [Microbacterium sp.]
AAPAAGAAGGPVLLASRDAIPEVVVAELRRLAPKRIVVVGSEASLSAAVARQAAALTTGSVERLAGIDRYGTSAAVSADAVAPGAPVVYLAAGADFADALSVAAAAGDAGVSVLLTERDSLPGAIKEELARLSPDRIVVIGGVDRVANSVIDEAAGFTTGEVSRIAGVDRYATAALVAKATTTAPVAQVYLTIGTQFPDALSGAAAAAATGSRILLTQGESLTLAAQQAITELQPARVLVLGDEASVAAETARLAGSYAR